ncbi:MAG: hypothetical protein WBL65_20510 [Bryobacteraceae bacterium]
MKRILVVALSGLLAVVMVSAGKKPPKLVIPATPPTEEQMRNTYAASVQILTALATNPMSIRVDPIETAWFELDLSKKGGNVWVEMWVAFYGQNSFGAIIRSTAMCHFYLQGSDAWGHKADCSSGPGDFLALGMQPKDMVQITRQKSSDAR